MSTGGSRVRKALFVLYLILVHLALGFLLYDRVRIWYERGPAGETLVVTDPTERQAIPTPLPVPEGFADPTQTPEQVIAPAGPGLAIPVVGVRPEDLIDTFTASRSEERRHDAIDIAAPVGTPVIAAADGEIVKFFDSERGGITIYQTTADGRFVLYYAHLQRRADEISVGSTVRKGTTLGYVGDTGNAGAGNYHLHFSIARITDPKRIWEGEYLNPFPFLRHGQYPPTE